MMCLVMVVGLVMTTSFGFAEETVKFWYHFDNPETALNPLIEKFEAENPGIHIEAERVAWDVYNQKLLTAVAGGFPPDVAQVKLWWQPQLVSMNALLPLDDYIANWPGKDDVFDRVWELTKYSDGHQYYMPLQMVILYLYYRVDMFEELGLEIPKTREEFLDVAKKLTRDTDGDGEIDVYGFGIRGARGGHDWWGTFVLSSGAQFFDENGDSGLTTPEAVAANQWFIDLYRVHNVSPPTTPSDGFKEIIANMKSGRTAMTIHHLGSAAQMEEALGDNISAVPVPMGSKGYWTSFGDEENAVFAATKVPDAAFKWAAFLAEAENNAIWQKSSGQVSINKSNASSDAGRFLKATTDSSDFAGVLPAHVKTAEFVESLWPALMQQAFSGEISSKEMMQKIAEHFTE
ncbi:sugar ABC transporter substrate-binding protein [candidate division KSB3 bacterium]|uniref:Sugar ABC transporter substrate-binding protein n=1 Tax=candidate division KSB3 bacterium TaxID=2044937 RepID=A0A2G6KG39_9BACT|nr:MAG: sugar ABC transporter substrate-binding protein [candidate division KSB3 bacterium]